MKKVWSLILATVLIFSLSACRDTLSNHKTDNADRQTTTTVSCSGNKTNDDNQSYTPEHTGKKIEGTITGVSEFSDGVALVCLDNNQEKTYCINKEGYILFELDKKIATNGTIYHKFVNGFALLDNGKCLCNKKGELIYPEDVGVTEFYDDALPGGYIIAAKVTADYSSTRKELGVMNADFEWVVEPREDLYAILEGGLSQAINKPSYYYDGYVCFKDFYKTYGYLNITTGELLQEAPFEIPSSMWGYNPSSGYYNENDELILDLTHLDNLCKLTAFINGKAGIGFYNQEANAYFFTMIDEKGNFLFDPINCGSTAFRTIAYDGNNTVMVSFGTVFQDVAAHCYNLKGELLGEMTMEDNGRLNILSFEDGIITLNSSYNFKSIGYYYNTDFTLAF